MTYLLLKGDSGSPLQHKKSAKFTIFGIVSRGPSLEVKNIPSIFVRVDSYLEWIYDTIESKMTNY